jgi:hypothetical protein
MNAPARAPTRKLHLLTLLAFCLLVACGPWTVIVQSGPPSALLGMNAIGVTFDYSQIAIGGKRQSEQDWLATREKEEHRQTYLQTKAEANRGMIQGVQKKLGGVAIAEGAAPAGGVQMNIVYLEWEEGVFTAVFNVASKIKARVQFIKDGRIVDEIEVMHQEAATMYMPTPQQRLFRAGEILGERARPPAAELTRRAPTPEVPFALGCRRLVTLRRP